MKPFHLVAPLVALATLAAGAGHTRELTFEERVAAQEAIDRIRYSHQIGATEPFERAVPRAVLERRVADYLDQSAALEQFWHTPITREMLSRELERMARQTMLPERLAQFFGALGHDRFLVEETLARATLADRLSRNYFAYDARIHAAARREAEQLHRDLASGEPDPNETHARRSVVALTPEEYKQGRDEMPADVGVAGPLQEEREAFIIRVVLEEVDGEEGQRARVATFAVPKRGWDDWFAEARRGFEALSVKAVAASGAELPELRLTGSPSLPCVADGTWSNGSLDTLGARAGHTAVWTGSEMIIWGGFTESSAPFGGDYHKTGHRYDPATDSWTAMNVHGAPAPRRDHTALWTGSEMIVWGGGQLFDLQTGGRYNPATDTWSSTSTLNAPSGRRAHTAVWTGTRMIVWGGGDPNNSHSQTGGRYDPATDSWTSTSTLDAPESRRTHTAIWTGSRMIVWGGRQSTNSGLRSGGVYDPTDDSWSATSPGVAGRYHHTAVWTGDEMIVWGGQDESVTLATGGRYDPMKDVWAATTVLGAPGARREHAAVWTGSTMIVWGGVGGVDRVGTGSRYDPVSDAWQATSTVGAPDTRALPGTVWTGESMLVWGGYAGSAVGTGGRYDLAADAWTQITTPVPLRQQEHTAVWTGSEMIVWGGRVGLVETTDSGTKYDPATDHWTSLSKVNGPSARVSHTAVWTGSRMIVWGGSSGSLQTGGRYDPRDDSWMPTTTVGAPAGRSLHTAVWTGSQMIVWGGNPSAISTSGGRYDPVTDSWTPTASPAGLVPATADHTAVWTGSRMIVWGGTNGNYPAGARYDPSTNSWTPTSQLGAPPPRTQHTVVWTGTHMIVWGGFSLASGTWLNDGGTYDPDTDIWVPTSQVDAPPGRSRHTAVWTGSRMIVWGGSTEVDNVGTESGGVYDPESATWTYTSEVAAPAARTEHSAVWTGSHMIVWGGRGGLQGSQSVFGTGGRYVFGSSVDDDGDAFSECDGDCNDGQATVYPGAVDFCDGFDNDCDGLVTETDLDGDDVCRGDCDDGDAGVFAVPLEVADLYLGPDKSTLVWQSAAPGAGSATVHDVVRGAVFELPVGDGASETCVAPGVSGNTTSDSDEPAPRSAYWYLVRGRNDCGAGPYGGSVPPDACP